MDVESAFKSDGIHRHAVAWLQKKKQLLHLCDRLQVIQTSAADHLRHIGELERELAWWKAHAAAASQFDETCSDLDETSISPPRDLKCAATQFGGDEDAFEIGMIREGTTSRPVRRVNAEGLRGAEHWREVRQRLRREIVPQAIASTATSERREEAEHGIGIAARLSTKPAVAMAVGAMRGLVAAVRGATSAGPSQRPLSRMEVLREHAQRVAADGLLHKFIVAPTSVLWDTAAGAVITEAKIAVNSLRFSNQNNNDSVDWPQAWERCRLAFSDDKTWCRLQAASGKQWDCFVALYSGEVVDQQHAVAAAPSGRTRDDENLRFAAVLRCMWPHRPNHGTNENDVVAPPSVIWFSFHDYSSLETFVNHVRMGQKCTFSSLS